MFKLYINILINNNPGKLLDVFIDKFQKNIFKEAFYLFNMAYSGIIDTDELKQVLGNLGIDAKNQILQNKYDE